jgi:ABC-2 type transport system ATP-binding protein
MGELQDAADQVVVVGRGRVLADATVDELLAGTAGEQVLLHTSQPSEAVFALEQASAEVAVTARGALTVTGVGAQRVVELLNQAGVAFSEVTTRRASLEDVYLQLTSSEAEYRAAVGWEQGR